MKSTLIVSALSASVNAYWLMGVDDLFDAATRLDPLVYPGAIAPHTHKVVGGSNFGPNADFASLRQSECTTTPIAEDSSSYWFPELHFEWANGSYSTVGGGVVIYYLFPDAKEAKTTPFPEGFRMLAGTTSLRTFNESDYAQQAVSHLCLDYGASKNTRYDGLPEAICPDGLRAQINFPSCWDGKNTDSPDHKSHVAYRSTGPDSGTCKDPNFPVSIPRIFGEIYWAVGDFTKVRDQARNPKQPFIYANGDETGYGYHGDFINAWKPETLERAVNECNCNDFGDPTCCAEKGIFTYEKNKKCKKTQMVDEKSAGLLDALPGFEPRNGDGQLVPSTQSPGLLDPVNVYTKGSAPEDDYHHVDFPVAGAAPAAPASTSSTIPDEATSTPADDSSSTDPEATSAPSNEKPSIASSVAVQPTGAPAGGIFVPVPDSTYSSSAAEPEATEVDHGDDGGSYCGAENATRRRRAHSRRSHHRRGVDYSSDFL